MRVESVTTGLPSRTLREAFSQFATGVAVATARRTSGECTAVTVNSFVSVSLDPPLVSFSLATQARCLAAFLECEALAVSVLRHDDQLVASNFARPSSCRWDGMPLRETKSGCLVIAHALAIFECVREVEYLAGDHVILLARVTSVRVGPAARPLVFFGSSYGSFTADQADRRVPASCSLDGGEIAVGWG